MMRKFVWGFLGFVLLYVASCKKESGCGYSYQNITVAASEQKAVKAYLDSNGIYALKDSSGMYYQLVQGGTGTSAASLCSQIEVTYTGKLTSGQVFEQKSTAFTLGSSIEGLKIGIPMIKKGGRVILYIPPSLAYGSSEVKDQSGKVVIPANSILIFDITLTNFE